MIARTMLVAFSAGFYAFPAHADITIKMLDPIVEARVDLTNQRLDVVVNGEKLHTWKISSGRAGYATPTGSYTPYRIHKMWHSRKYNNAPMPYSVFYDGGFAIHGTSAVSRLGRPASHGCVRLRTSNAKKFYELVTKYGRNRTAVKLTGRWKHQGKKTAKVVNRKRRSSRLRRSKRSRFARGLSD